MSELRRRLMMQVGGGPILPPEYQQVLYIGTNNTEQYIYTNINIPIGTIIELSCMWEESGSLGMIFGYLSGGGNCYICDYGGGVYTHGLGNTEPNPYIFAYTGKLIEYKDDTMYIDGEVARSETLTNSAIGDAYLGIFAISYGVYQNATKRRFYHLKAGDIADIYPCYRKSDGVPGVYDIVNDVFYTNAGTGDFTVGPVVNVRGVG